MTSREMAVLHALCFTSPRPWDASEFDTLLAQKAVFYCSNKDGFILGRHAGPEIELLTLAVHPDARRKGIGRHLLAEFKAAALSRGAKEIFLEVTEDNDAARGLYHKGGFVDVGIRKDYYAGSNGKKQTAIVMRCNL